MEYFYYPLIKLGDRFVEAPESIALGWQRAVFPELEHYFERNYRAAIEVVELGGEVCSTTVFLPKSADDIPYVVADGDRIPKGAQKTELGVSDLVKDYVDNMADALAYSEAITAEQAAYLPSEFITPTFEHYNAETGQRSGERSWDEVIRSNRSVLLGDPGAGKTSCLRRLVIELRSRLAQGDADARVPVYVQLRKWDPAAGVLDNIFRSSSPSGAAIISSEFKRLASNGRAILILDGLDEISDFHRHSVAASINKFAVEQRTLGMVLSSRATSYSQPLPGFVHYVLNPFSDSQMREWSYKRLYRYSDKSWDTFYGQLWAQRALFELARNPMMLSTACYSYIRNSLLPQNSAVLIADYVHALVDEWDKVRGVTRSTELWASPMKKFAALCRAAFRVLSSNKASFSSEDFLRWESDRTDSDYSTLLLRALSEHTGLVGHTQSTWMFVHRAVARYLTASHLVERTDDVSKILLSRVEDGEWSDVWIGACGLAQDPTYLFQALLASERLDNGLKAALITRALSQNISLDNKALEASYRLVREVVEQYSVFLKLAEKGRASFIQGVDFEVEGNRSIDPFIRLVEGLYFARKGTASDWVSRLSSDIKNDVIANILACFAHDGRMEIERHGDVATYSLTVRPISHGGQAGQRARN